MCATALALCPCARTREAGAHHVNMDCPAPGRISSSEDDNDARGEECQQPKDDTRGKSFRKDRKDKTHSK